MARAPLRGALCTWFLEHFRRSKELQGAEVQKKVGFLGLSPSPSQNSHWSSFTVLIPGRRRRDPVSGISHARELAGCSKKNGMPCLRHRRQISILRRQSAFPRRTAGIISSPGILCRGRSGPPRSKFRRAVKLLQGGERNTNKMVHESKSWSAHSKSWSKSICPTPASTGLWHCARTSCSLPT